MVRCNIYFAVHNRTPVLNQNYYVDGCIGATEVN